MPPLGSDSNQDGESFNFVYNYYIARTFSRTFNTMGGATDSSSTPIFTNISVSCVSGDKASLSLTDKIVNGKLMVQQGIIAGCAGGNYTNVMESTTTSSRERLSSVSFS